MRRIDYKLIEDLVPEGATVLDLACGDGELLSELIAESTSRQRRRDRPGRCREVHRPRPLRLPRRPRRGPGGLLRPVADVVILSMSLQQLRRPRMIVREMARVGRLAIVSFPNFAHWVPRMQLLLRGRMPVSRDLPYQWWDTPNIHLCTIRDFRGLCRAEGLCIENELYLRSVEKPAPERRGPDLPARSPSSRSRAASRSRRRRRCRCARPTASGFGGRRFAGTLPARSASQRPARTAQGAHHVRTEHRRRRASRSKEKESASG